MSEAAEPVACNTGALFSLSVFCFRSEIKALESIVFRWYHSCSASHSCCLLEPGAHTKINQFSAERCKVGL